MLFWQVDVKATSLLRAVTEFSQVIKKKKNSHDVKKGTFLHLLSLLI